jgi:cytochrome c oxidase assembly protein subunit 15
MGFGTTVVTWALAYVCRLPAVMAPSWVVGAFLILSLLGGGVLAGRWLRSGSAAWVGARVGALSCTLDLLILGSFLADQGAQAVTWVPGTLLLGAGLGAAGAALGRATSSDAACRPTNWVSAFARVALGATLLLLAVGGVVTGAEAGLAVPDWPNTYTSNMFLYPLSRMTGGIYYEHTHRLLGSLVGLTTLAFTVVVTASDDRGWLKGLAWGAFVLVCAQGLLGGLRVTGSLTLSTDPNQLNPSTHLAVVHGVTAQVFFSILAFLAAAVSTTWRSAPAPGDAADAEAAEREAGILAAAPWVVGLVFAQLVLGALVRHLGFEVTWHVTLAVVVIIAGGSLGLRAWASSRPVLPRVGLALLILLGIQLLLGVGALATTAVEDSPIAAAQIPVTTAHQTAGALILATSVLGLVWSRRLLPR